MFMLKWVEMNNNSLITNNKGTAVIKGALCVCDREIYHTINSTIQSIE